MSPMHLVWVLVGFLLGCSENHGNRSEEPLPGGVFDNQLEAIDEAKALEQQLLDNAARRRQAIKEQGG